MHSTAEISTSNWFLRGDARNLSGRGSKKEFQSLVILRCKFWTSVWSLRLRKTDQLREFYLGTMAATTDSPTEDENDVFLNSTLFLLPSKPKEDCTFEEQALYMEKTFAFLKAEIDGLKCQDKILMKKFRSMIGAVERIKKFKETVEAQREILGELTEQEPTLDSNYVDKPMSVMTLNRDRKFKRQVSNYQRYNRIGFDGRHASFH